MATQKPELWFFAVAALFSGAALLIAVFSHAPLWACVLLAAVLAGTGVSVRWRATAAPLRREVRRKAAIGLLGGFLGTCGYDLARFFFALLTRSNYAPFESLRFFGYSIGGSAISQAAAYILGGGFHLLNGICFGMAYCLFWGGRHWTLAVVWALFLEAVMFSIYPTWLNLAAVKLEFTLVSLSGHLAYGLILGITSQSKLAAPQMGNHGSC